MIGVYARACFMGLQVLGFANKTDREAHTEKAKSNTDDESNDWNGDWEVGCACCSFLFCVSMRRNMPLYVPSNTLNPWPIGTYAVLKEAGLTRNTIPVSRRARGIRLAITGVASAQNIFEDDATPDVGSSAPHSPAPVPTAPDPEAWL